MRTLEDAKGRPQNRTWCIWSTAESVQNEVPSVMAIFETAVAVPLYWWIALRLGALLPLLIGIVAAPLVLLRSEASVAHGMRWFRRYERNLSIDHELKYIALSRTERRILWIFGGFSAAAALVLVWLIIRYNRLSIEAWIMSWPRVSFSLAAVILARSMHD